MLPQEDGYYYVLGTYGGWTQFSFYQKKEGVPLKTSWKDLVNVKRFEAEY